MKKYNEIDVDRYYGAYILYKKLKDFLGFMFFWIIF